MPDDDLRFARWLANLVGWAHLDSAMSHDADATERWLKAGRIEQDGKIVRFTDTGQTWCRKYGIS